MILKKLLIFCQKNYSERLEPLYNGQLNSNYINKLIINLNYEN
jgi:hypothetical protein